MVSQGILSFCARNVVFPASKRTIVYTASECACPGDVLIALLDLPDRTYLSEDDLLCALGDPAYCV